MTRNERKARSYLHQFRGCKFSEGAAHCAAMVVISCLKANIQLGEIGTSISRLRAKVRFLITTECKDLLEKNTWEPPELPHLFNKILQAGTEMARELGVELTPLYPPFKEITGSELQQRAALATESREEKDLAMVYRLVFQTGVMIDEIFTLVDLETFFQPAEVEPV